MQAVTIIKTQGAKIRGEPTTIGMVDLKPNQQAARLTPVDGSMVYCFIWLSQQAESHCKTNC